MKDVVTQMANVYPGALRGLPGPRTGSQRIVTVTLLKARHENQVINLHDSPMGGTTMSPAKEFAGVFIRRIRGPGTWDSLASLQK